jgi:hypothetical protein
VACRTPARPLERTAQRMGISGDLQLMSLTEQLSLHSDVCVAIPLWFTNPPLTETRRQVRRQVRKEAAKP